MHIAEVTSRGESRIYEVEPGEVIAVLTDAVPGAEYRVATVARLRAGAFGVVPEAVSAAAELYGAMFRIDGAWVLPAAAPSLADWAAATAMRAFGTRLQLTDSRTSAEAALAALLDEGILSCAA